MLCNRIKQFREYNKLDPAMLAELLQIDVAEYEEYEKGTLTPDIDTIYKLAECYKVTISEFYGYTPHLQLHSKDYEDLMNNNDDNVVDEKILKMADLSWEEAQLILYYRNLENKEEIISQIIHHNHKKEDE